MVFVAIQEIVNWRIKEIIRENRCGKNSRQWRNTRFQLSRKKKTARQDEKRKKGKETHANYFVCWKSKMPKMPDDNQIANNSLKNNQTCCCNHFFHRRLCRRMKLFIFFVVCLTLQASAKTIPLFIQIIWMSMANRMLNFTVDIITMKVIASVHDHTRQSSPIGRDDFINWIFNWKLLKYSTTDSAIVTAQTRIRIRIQIQKKKRKEKCHWK